MALDSHRFMTKTQHYRKVTKPLLERKRRARMNLYLDELKDLIVDTMDEQGEQVNKLEKADILELTVNYLKTQQQQRMTGIRAGTPPACSSSSSSSICTPTSPPPPETQLNFDKFHAGYTQAAYEVSHIFSTVPGLDLKFGTHLMKQLGHQLKDMKQQLSSPVPSEDATEPVNLADVKQRRSTSPQENLDMGEEVWRPW
ncbi:enhancer of split mdelta protein [Drosophila grimshawi]|uniref:GH19451 n=1 Tax=Drosophila grimshawi TaxID=7222 RepID=B4JGH9_DROGR|nr:enhancer of split mdelta protein [Drosophila grimshawi]EDV93676.1 GH19451 [Drosophila grimshawi]